MNNTFIAIIVNNIIVISLSIHVYFKFMNYIN